MTLTPEQEAALLAKLAAKTPTPGILTAIYQTIRELAGSKKFLVAVGTGMVFVAKKLGLDISAQTAQDMLVLGCTVIGGFAVQDFGESKAKADAVKIEVKP